MFERLPIPTPFQIGRVNAYLAGRTLVDPGPDSEDALSALEDELAERDLQIEDLRRVLVTHAHPDHFGLSNRLSERGVDVLASEPAAAILGDFEGRLEYEQAYLSALFEAHGMAPETTQTVVQLPEAFMEFAPSVEVDRALTDGDVLDVGDTEVRVRERAGHSECDLLFEWREGDDRSAADDIEPPHGINPGDALRDRDDGAGSDGAAGSDDAEGQHAAIVGDHVLPETTPNPFLQPPEREDGGDGMPAHEGVPAYDGPAELDDLRPRTLPPYNRSLDEIRDAGFDRLHPGHGEVIDDPSGRIDEIRAAHEERSEAVLEVVDGPTTALEVMQGLFPDLPVIDYFPGMSEAVGHLDVLVERGALVRDVEDGTLVYMRADGNGSE
jgi:glyoxylase-like metal-dependent hydrolase (beta-lactamase superfamily II)